MYSEVIIQSFLLSTYSCMNVLNYLDDFGYINKQLKYTTFKKTKLTEGRSHNINKRNEVLLSYPKRIRHNKQIMYKNITTTTVVSGMAYKSYKNAVNTNS